MEINIFINNDDDDSSSKNNEVDLMKVRNDPRMKVAKKEVKKRDNVCQVCGESDMQLQVHHILPVALYPDLAYDDRNMITLCQKCHKEYHQCYEGSEGAVSFVKYVQKEMR